MLEIIMKLIQTNRLKTYAASKEQMESFIEKQSVDVLKRAYTEMLEGAIRNPNQWGGWNAIWMIELKDGTHIGEMCFITGRRIDIMCRPFIMPGISRVTAFLEISAIIYRSDFQVVWQDLFEQPLCKVSE